GGVGTVLDLSGCPRQGGRDLVPPAKGPHNIYLRRCPVIRINARHADARVVDMEHDRHGIGLRLVEHLPEHRHHEVAGGVVVVVKEHLVKLRPLELPLALGFCDDSAVRIHALGHRSTFYSLNPLSACHAGSPLWMAARSWVRNSRTARSRPRWKRAWAL